MASVIAGIYEIQEQIGAGGGGIVYRGRHQRLDKQIVLKADKRTLDTKPETLRREVDMLKGLSHTYIPQVYDFVQENGVVYTVMDFIDGESLDHLLNRGQALSQPQVIRWACQLLEALVYLHGRPPHGILHGDIKPANIMLRPNGDICLIDYNIALALGEDGAVRAGFSRGYASPEHYGIEYISGRRQAAWRTSKEPPKSESDKNSWQTTEIEKTVRESEFGQTEETVKEEEGSESRSARSGLSGTGSTTGSGKTVLLDVRSDIYSLGATLYHLISGRRPAQDAPEVEPLGPEVCSPAVSRIIEKAMSPDPETRYQTAAEMLTAFRRLHRDDIRVRRHRRREAVTAAVLSVMFLCGGAGTFVGMRQLEQTQEALALAEYSANDLAEGNRSGAVRQALKGIPTEQSLFNAPVTAQAQKALTDALGVYNLSDGFTSLDTVELPAAPFTVAISPGGARFAVVYQQEAAVFDTESQERIAVLPAENSALADVVFVDEKTVLYAGEQGVTAYDLERQKVLWSGDQATTLSVSGDKKVAAAVNRDAGYAVVYSVADGEKIAQCSFEGHEMAVAANDIFANPGNRIFALNGDGSLLAVSFSKGELWLFDVSNPEQNMIIYDETDYRHFEGGFCGDYFAFAANKGDESLFGLVDAVEGVYVGAMDSRDNFLLKADETGIYLANQNVLVQFDPDTLEETELAYTSDKNITGFFIGDSCVMTATDDNGFSFYNEGAALLSSEICQEPCDFIAMAGEYALAANRSQPSVRLMKLESHEEAQIWSYDARYVHDEARVSGDGNTAMLFNYEDFRVYDREGNVVAQTELPESEYIYDQQFRKSEDGSWLEVIWYDGTVRCYSAGDGSLISETRGEPPSEDLYEEFFTDEYRITSPLHGTPQVYDRESGREVGELESDSYLTYVTQVGEYIVTEYTSAAGERYGLLLNGRLETLAYLPGLCDISDGELVFDYGTGSLRQCRLYSLRELVELGEMYLQTY